MKRLLVLASLALSLSVQAQSELSAISVAPVALSVMAVSATGAALSVAPSAILSAGMTLTVVSVEIVGGVTVWVLERASDGARIVVKASGKLAEGVGASVGGAVMVSAFGAGTLLSVAGEVIAFIPNEIGKALLYNERVSR